MINEIKKHSLITPSCFGGREFGLGARGSDNLMKEPMEVSLEMETRWIGEGIRNKEAKALFLASYVPLFLAAEAAASGDSGGLIMLIACCAITMYVFGLTGWGNEKIK